ncbi:interferon regulatory factor 8 [Aplochiton taeniatus]
MSVSGGRRLKQWLVEQIHSRQYSGLLWEDDSNTMFRIPWKHAGKQDYNQEIDASIFKSWAVFKGKFKEGDKAEPATWKTRLRCALNKSPDFEEVAERSQLDISEPYKVYRIVPEDEQKSGKGTATTSTVVSGDITDMECNSADLQELIKETSNEEYMSIIKRSHSPQEEGYRMQPSPDYWPQGSISGKRIYPLFSSTPTQCCFDLPSAFSQMVINFYYGGKLMHTVVSSHPEGCRITPGQPALAQSVYYGPEGMQSVRFPSAELIENERQRHVTRKLMGHLERGVLVRANREGIFIKRLCQSRVFWSGLGPHYSPGPCKLERDAVVKIFDTARFLQALQLHQEGHVHPPDPNVTLCFGEELHDLSTSKNKLIIVQITALNCQQLLEAVDARRSQSYSSPSLDMSDELASDQVARIYQELCSYSAPQRATCYRDNMTITA